MITDSSSFSMPVGIWGTARLMEAYSCRSGRSSQRKTGNGLDASSARARNDNLLIFRLAQSHATDERGKGSRAALSWGSPCCAAASFPPSRRDQNGASPGAPGVRGLLPAVVWRRSVRSGVCLSPSLFNTPWPTWRTLKLRCLLPQPTRAAQPFPECIARLRVHREEGGGERAQPQSSGARRVGSALYTTAPEVQHAHTAAPSAHM